VTGRVPPTEPDVLVKELAGDEAIKAADTLLLTIPNQLGVDYYAHVPDSTVVIMGEEIVDPIANTPNAGKTVRRRFTAIWKIVDGVWKLTIRQATVTSVQ
jgi:hypothetical protein